MARQNARLAIRLYGVLLHFYPADFRQSYGDAMTCAFEESLSDAFVKSGPGGVLKLWLHTLTDLATAALAEWTSRFMAILGIEQQTSLGASIAITIVLFTLVLMGLSGGGLHLRSSTTPACGEVSISHSSSSAHQSAATIPPSRRVAR